jgi:HNH endonuclease
MAWLARITICGLETGTGPCAHLRETRGYRPSAALRHLIKIRDRRCSFPGCGRQAVRCDDDHTIAYDQGGRTCECNLSTLCRQHHRAKQATGWRLTQTAPGTLTWTLPHGRSYTTTPGHYPG